MKSVFTFSLIICMTLALNAREYTLTSPSGKIALIVSAGEKISWSVTLNGRQVISPSEISLTTGDKVLGVMEKDPRAKNISVSETITPVVPFKNAIIKNIYNSLALSFRDFTLHFRAYDDGIAYRWEVRAKSPFKIKTEQATFAFPADFHVWFPEEESMFSHQERSYVYRKLSSVTADRFASTGLLVDGGDNLKIFISESDLTDYPGMFLQGCKENPQALCGKFAGVVLETDQKNDRDVRPVKYADYIAERQGAGTLPWRTVIIVEKDADLVHSEMIYKLAHENVLAETSWIKPGKVAWDWWNACNIYGVDFKSGINNQTYKYYIDFASKYGLEYIILDEGWYHLDNIMHVVDEIDIRELVEYGKQKNVGVILWVVWKALDDKLTEALDQFRDWGVKGIKIDFMQRDDQWMVNFYEKIARECAARQLLVDYHGAYKPAGLNRKYPNVLSFEGLKGLENAKWSDQPDPEHNVTLPFIRMVAGPMDFTPGAMINATKQNFKPVFNQPMSPGTRCHQLAMYVVFESPLQMLADHPSNYYREPESMEFLKAVPSVWDETRVLEAKVGDYILIARRSGDTWYVGAMTDWSSRNLEADLSFLGEGNFTVHIWKDGINADKYAADYKTEQITATKNTRLPIQMAPGGGWAARITKTR